MKGERGDHRWLRFRGAFLHDPCLFLGLVGDVSKGRASIKDSHTRTSTLFSDGDGRDEGSAGKNSKDGFDKHDETLVFGIERRCIERVDDSWKNGCILNVDKHKSV